MSFLNWQNYKLNSFQLMRTFKKPNVSFEQQIYEMDNLISVPSGKIIHLFHRNTNYIRIVYRFIREDYGQINQLLEIE